MEIAARYSHLNGEEFLIVHKKRIWNEVLEIISEVDANACKTKISKEQRSEGELFFSPKDMNKAFSVGFKRAGWKEHRNQFWVTADEKILREIYERSESEQKEAIEAAGHIPIMSYNQTDFVKNRVAVEVQFGKYSFVAHDLFVKHLGFYVSDIIDVGIEILPMKTLEKNMSSGVPYYERDLLNLVRQGRGVPAVPLVLIGVAP